LKINCLASLAVVLILAAGSGSASGGCSPDDRLKLFEQGWDRAKVDQFCGGTEAASVSPPNNNSAAIPNQQPATSCVTSVGRCPLTVAGYKGGPCTCYTTYGTYFGVLE
jgi:hypothetical protein